MNLVSELVDLCTEKFHEHLDIRVQLFVPVEERLEWTALYTFNARWNQVLIVIGQQRSWLPRRQLERPTERHQQELKRIFSLGQWPVYLNSYNVNAFLYSS